ncbi:MAG: T9SS type A sorting domain-containing protein [Bacteroidota bacterium]
MKKIYILALIISCFSIDFMSSQEDVICSAPDARIYFSSADNIPEVSTNSDGTVTLTSSDENLTDIFNNYVIYDFYRTYPDSSSDFFSKIYTIIFETKDLIEDLLFNVSSEDYEFFEGEFYDLSLPIRNPIDASTITALDNKTFELIAYQNVFDGCDGDCGFIQLSGDDNLLIEFNYDETQDLILAESITETPCGNDFAFALAGGNPQGFTNTDNQLQLWQAENLSATMVNFNDPCYHLEFTINNILDIGCNDTYNYGNITLNVDANLEEGEMSLRRLNAIFGFDVLLFTEADLSVEEKPMKNLFFFEQEGNPYLQISNLNEQTELQIFDLSGRVCLEQQKFQNNKIDVSHLESGLYLINTVGMNNQQKIVKFLKK